MGFLGNVPIILVHFMRLPTTRAVQFYIPGNFEKGVKHFAHLVGEKWYLYIFSAYIYFTLNEVSFHTLKSHFSFLFL